MKRPRFNRARTIFQRTLRGAPGLVKSQREFLSRALADIRRKEYTVFVEPALKQFRKPFRLGSGSSRAAEALPAPQQNAPPALPAHPGQAGGDLVDPRLVEEIFARSTPHVVRPEESHELGRWDADEPAAAPSPEGSVSAEAGALEIGSDGPVETTSGADGSTETGTTPPRPANGPMVHTMVEAFPDTPADGDGDGGLVDFLSEDLQNIFSTTNHGNPRTKALLKDREQVDVHELADELKEYARSIGAVSPAPRKG